MLLIFLSTFESMASSSRMALSPRMAGPFVTVPSILPPPPAPAELLVPTVPWPPFTTPLPLGAPDEFAVPALLVPGELSTVDELPEPDGSLAELFNPAELAGPDGMPFTPWLPEPAAPAPGVPATP